MLVTISQITRYLKAADDALALAENYIDKEKFEAAQALAVVSSANTKLAVAYMYARETSILAAGPDSDQAPLPFE